MKIGLCRPPDDAPVMFRELSAPIAVQWETTSACPKRCFYCANYWRHDHDLSTQPALAPKEAVEQIVEQIICARVFSVTITGGEPLLVLDRLAPQLRRLAQAGIVLSLNSTLAVLTADLASLLSELGIRSALVSIPSHDPTTDALITNSASSWRSTAAGIALALQAGLKIEANMVVCRHNVGQIFSTAKYAKDLGITYFAATKMSHPSTELCLTNAMLSTAEFRLMASELKRVRDELGMRVDTVQAYPFCSLADGEIREAIPAFSKTCSAAKTFCMVAPNGQVRPCPLVSDVFGNVMDRGGLLGAWRAMRSWRDDSLLPPQCLDCRHKSSCAGGCKADAKHSGGGYRHLDPYCDLKNVPVMPKTMRKSVDLSSRYRANPKVRLRSEAFGGIIYVRGAEWCAVDGRLYGMFQKPTAVYRREDFARELGVSDSEANRTMNHLVEKNLLVEFANGKEVRA